MKAQARKDAFSRRKAVTNRFRRFFAELTAKLAPGTTEILSRAERAIAQERPPIETERSTPPLGNIQRMPMQQQPMQQQQQGKLKPDDTK